MDPEQSYSQGHLFNPVKKTVYLPPEFDAPLREIMELNGYEHESDVFVGMFFYCLAFYSEHHLSAQVMRDTPDIRESCFREAVERFHRLKHMTPEQRKAAEGFGPALSAHIAKREGLRQ